MTTDELKKGNWVKLNEALVKVTDIIDNKTVIVSDKYQVSVECLEPIHFIKEEWCVASINHLFKENCDAIYFHELQNLNPEFTNVDLKIINGEILILKK